MQTVAVLTNITIGLLWLMAIVQGVVIVALIHQVAALRTIANAGGIVVPELPVGSLAPHFAAVDLQSKRSIQSSTLSGRRIVLCFMNADCHVCRTLAFELSNKSADALVGLVVYYDGVVDTSGTIFQSLASKIPVLCKDVIDVPAEFHLEKFPVAVVIDEAWRIAGISHPVRADDLLASLAGAPEQALPAASALTRMAG